MWDLNSTPPSFTLLKAAFLDPLPYRDAGRLVTIVKNNGGNPSVSEFLEIRERSRTLDQIAFAEHGDAQLGGTAEPVRVFAARALITSPRQPGWGGSPMQSNCSPRPTLKAGTGRSYWPRNTGTWRS